MKKSEISKVVLVFTIVLIIISCLAVVSLASESFEDVVGGIDKTANYMTRFERVERADSIYSQMSDEEKNGVSSFYAELNSEREELRQLAERADRFIFFVNGFADLHDLDDKVSAVDAARSEDVIFSDTSYPGITETLDALRTFERATREAVECCDNFIEFVYIALDTDESDYSSLSSMLSLAGRYVDRIDSTYDGISDAYASYAEMLAALRVKEEYTEEFLRAVEDISTKEDYKSFRAAYNYAKDYTKNESFIRDYPGVDKALTALVEAEEVMKEAILRANDFIYYVNSLGTAGNVAKELIESYSHLEGVDFTVDGASAAKAILDGAIEAYNADVERINKDFSYV